MRLPNADENPFPCCGGAPFHSFSCVPKVILVACMRKIPAGNTLISGQLFPITA